MNQKKTKSKKATTKRMEKYPGRQRIDYRTASKIVEDFLNIPASCFFPKKATVYGCVKDYLVSCETGRSSIPTVEHFLAGLLTEKEFAGHRTQAVEEEKAVQAIRVFAQKMDEAISAFQDVRESWKSTRFVGLYPAPIEEDAMAIPEQLAKSLTVAKEKTDILIERSASVQEFRERKFSDAELRAGFNPCGVFYGAMRKLLEGAFPDAPKKLIGKEAENVVIRWHHHFFNQVPNMATNQGEKAVRQRIRTDLQDWKKYVRGGKRAKKPIKHYRVARTEADIRYYSADFPELWELIDIPGNPNIGDLAYEFEHHAGIYYRRAGRTREESLANCRKHIQRLKEGRFRPIVTDKTK